jgi:membrane protein DedA with SNARE-associated domain
MIKENVQDFFLFFLIPLSNTDDPCFFLKNIFASFVWATVSTTLGIWHFRKKEIR